MPSDIANRVVILGTGGTIAGCAASPTDHVGYTASQRGVAELLGALTAEAAIGVEVEQVAQLDSKDMDHATWQRLAKRAGHHLARPDVAGVVVTHGTDTLEETAWFLHRVLAPTKPLVLTAAMRPATALSADGPQNLIDALLLARLPTARGVLVMIGGQAFGALGLRKLHPYRVDAFGSADGGALGVVEAGVWRGWRDWPSGQALGLARVQGDVSAWPQVEIVTSHGGANGGLVQALVATGVNGLVVAGTGNASRNVALEPSLAQAVAQGVAVWYGTRCALGATVGQHTAGDSPPDPSLSEADTALLSPWQARVELLLRLLAQTTVNDTSMLPRVALE